MQGLSTIGFPEGLIRHNSKTRIFSSLSWNLSMHLPMVLPSKDLNQPVEVGTFSYSLDIQGHLLRFGMTGGPKKHTIQTPNLSKYYGRLGIIYHFFFV